MEEKKRQKSKGKASERHETPLKEEKKISQGDYEKRILELSGEGLTSEKIGEMLRKEGIHPKNYNKKISKILKENNLYVSPDLKNIEEKLSRINEHYGKNGKDKRAMREGTRISAKVRKLKKYLKILPSKKL